MALPYPSNPGQFQRVKGKFEYMGMSYQLVKQKFEGDTLIVVCIPDREEKRAVEFIYDYAQLVNELPATSKTNLQNFAKTLQEFVPIFESPCTSLSTGWTQSLAIPSFIFQENAIDILIPSPPPRG